MQDSQDGGLDQEYLEYLCSPVEPSTVQLASRSRKRPIEPERQDPPTLARPQDDKGDDNEAEALNKILMIQGIGYIMSDGRLAGGQHGLAVTHDTDAQSERYAHVDRHVQRRLVLFNHYVVPRLKQELLGTEAFGYFRQAMYGARDSWGGLERVDVSRAEHNHGYGDPAHVVLIEDRKRNRRRKHRPMTVGTQDELQCIDFTEPDEEDSDVEVCSVLGEQVRVIMSDVDAAVRVGAQRARRALEEQRGPDAETKGAWERAQQAAAEVVGTDRCNDASAAENGHRKCGCLRGHMRAAQDFVVTYRDAVGARLDLVGLNLKSRELLHKHCGRLINQHMNRGKHNYIVSHTDRMSGTMRVTVVAKLCRPISGAAPALEGMLAAPPALPVEDVAMAEEIAVLEDAGAPEDMAESADGAEADGEAGPAQLVYWTGGGEGAVVVEDDTEWEAALCAAEEERERKEQARSTTRRSRFANQLT